LEWNRRVRWWRRFLFLKSHFLYDLISFHRSARLYFVPQGYSARLSVLFRKAICSIPRGYLFYERLSIFREAIYHVSVVRSLRSRLYFHSLYVWGDCKSLHICIHPAHEPVLLSLQPFLVSVITLCHHGRDALFRIGACNKALTPEPS
jgi:hypothetical protein